MKEIKTIYRSKSGSGLKLKGSVALVGNSDLLGNQSLGDEIDSHDHVFRFNLASTEKQYQQAVGIKSDYYFFSKGISTVKFPHSEQLMLRFKRICRTSNIICYPGHEKNIIPYNKRPFCFGLDIPQINQIFNQLIDNPYQFSQNRQPRNGLKLLACLLEVGIKPDLYGFDISNRDDNNHYFDDELQYEGDKVGHIPSAEYKILRALLDQGLIVVKP